MRNATYATATATATGATDAPRPLATGEEEERERGVADRVTIPFLLSLLLLAVSCSLLCFSVAFSVDLNPCLYRVVNDDYHYMCMLLIFY